MTQNTLRCHCWPELREKKKTGPAGQLLRSQLSQQRTNQGSSSSQSLLPLPYLLNQIFARSDRKNMAKEACMYVRLCLDGGVNFF
jgi:hypothetical protein